MEFSFYEDAKTWLGGYIPLHRDWWHVILGFAIATVGLYYWRVKRVGIAPVGAFVVSGFVAVAMEVLDFTFDVVNGNSLHWREHGTDIIWTTLFPVWALAAITAYGQVTEFLRSSSLFKSS